MKKITTIAALAIALGAGFGAAPAASAASTYLGGVDMQRACDTQYPGWGLRAEVIDQHNAYSWRCTVPWDRSSYGIDVNRECALQYDRSAYSGLRDAHNPYSWFCQR
jgi:hypothetical protein